METEVAVKLIKLVSGENIVAMTNADCDNLLLVDFITISDPVAIRTFRQAQDNVIYESFTMQHWIGISTNGTIQLPTRHIITTADLKDNVIDYYFKFLENSSLGEDLQIMDEADSDFDPDDEFFDEQPADPEEEYDDRQKPTLH